MNDGSSASSSVAELVPLGARQARSPGRRRGARSAQCHRRSRACLRRWRRPERPWASAGAPAPSRRRTSPRGRSGWRRSDRPTRASSLLQPRERVAGGLFVDVVRKELQVRDVGLTGLDRFRRRRAPGARRAPRPRRTVRGARRLSGLGVARRPTRPRRSARAGARTPDRPPRPFGGESTRSVTPVAMPGARIVAWSSRSPTVSSAFAETDVGKRVRRELGRAAAGSNGVEGREEAARLGVALRDRARCASRSESPTRPRSTPIAAPSESPESTSGSNGARAPSESARKLSMPSAERYAWAKLSAGSSPNASVAAESSASDVSAFDCPPRRRSPTALRRPSR